MNEKTFFFTGPDPVLIQVQEMSDPVRLVPDETLGGAGPPDHRRECDSIEIPGLPTLSGHEAPRDVTDKEAVVVANFA